MLVSGAQVLIREGSTIAQVEVLKISDLVFDPWADKYVEIVDILSRTIEFPCDDGKNPPPLFPVRIEPGQLSSERPRAPLIVSPSQVVLFSDHQEGQKYPVVKKCMVKDLPSDGSKKMHIKRIRYHALFTQNSQIIDVRGALLSTYSTDIYEKQESGIYGEAGI